MARAEGVSTPLPCPPLPHGEPRPRRLSRRSLLKGAGGVAGVAMANELTGRPLLPSHAEAHEVIPREPQPGSKRSTSPLDKFIQKGAEAAQSSIGAIRKELASLAGKPAAAHGLDQKTTKSAIVAAVGLGLASRRAVELRPSSMINNVETFGNEQALTDTEMKQLIENLNARVGALSPEERAAMMRDDTYYDNVYLGNPL